VYVGRIDANKGCAELFDFFIPYVAERTMPATLVLIGKPVMEIPNTRSYATWDSWTIRTSSTSIAGAAGARHAVYYESCRWPPSRRGRLASPSSPTRDATCCSASACAATRGCTTLTPMNSPRCSDTLLDDAPSRARLGAMAAVLRAELQLAVIERKYLDMFTLLSSNRRATAWRSCRAGSGVAQRSLRPAAQVLDELPSGPVVDRIESERRA
jgi:hypothetical protein